LPNRQRRRPGPCGELGPPVKPRGVPFYNVQPYLYRACTGQSAASPCQSEGPGPGFEWNFSFGNDFQGTNMVENDLFIMVCYASAPAIELSYSLSSRSGR
jgi:hypothetical protein